MQDEAEWVRLAKSGDQDAFGRLVHLYHDRVYRLLLRLVRNPEMAQELEQQTWIKVWSNLSRFREQSAFFTWVYTIATRNAHDYRRKLKRRGEVEYQDEWDHSRSPSQGTRPDRELMNRETGAKIQQALDQCGDKHRTVLILREMEGLSYEEMARVLKCSTGTVMSRLHHARRAMREHLQRIEA